MIRRIVMIMLAVMAALPGASLAEDREETAAPVVVCVLDAGCNLPEVEQRDYLPQQEMAASELAHGSMVCQIIRENAPEAQVYMLRCLCEDDNGLSLDAQNKAVIQAIYDAVDVYHADVLNISWTLNQPDESLHEAITYAHEKGAILVAAAGNLSLQTPLGSQVYPAVWDEVIGVGGVDLDEQGTPISSLWYLQNDAVFVCANGSWCGQRGTSFAAPRVSAWIANVLQAENGATDAEIREMLQDTVQDLGEEGYDTVFGWGYLEMAY